MEIQSSPIESLIERAEQYSKTSIELYRMKAIAKTADVVSSLASKLVVMIFFTLFFLVLNIGVALWIGDILGKSYFGFFIVASFYALVSIIMYIYRNKWIKSPMRNSIIFHLLN